jgi:BON domain-containing protein
MTRMPTERGRTPRSYDEILRRTVVDPDSSFRPSKAQEDEADEQFTESRAHAQMTPHERELYQRVAHSLLSRSLGDIGFEVEDRRVTLRGSVRDADAMSIAEQLARAVPGVDDVVNLLVVKR